MKKFAIPLILCSFLFLLLGMTVLVQLSSIPAARAELGYSDTTFPNQATTQAETQSAPGTTQPGVQTETRPSSAPSNGSGAVYDSSGYPVVSVANKVLPSIVGIETETEEGVAYGTGIIVSEDGYIVTNYHIIDEHLDIFVNFREGGSVQAKLIGGDKGRDIALLKVNMTGLTPAEFGDSKNVVAGELAVVIGNPGGNIGLEGSVFAGIISSPSREVTVENYPMRLIQTDAAVNAGNSGGALCNAKGQVIGITSLSYVSFAGRSTESLHFAIPSNTALRIINDLLTLGYVQGRPLIGINGHDLSAIEQRDRDLPGGILVDMVEQTSDAYRKGLRVGDVITSIDGVRVYSMSRFNELKDEHDPGDTVTITVFRNGTETTYDVVLYERTVEG